jgi:hypothetical protein
MNYKILILLNAIVSLVGALAFYYFASASRGFVYIIWVINFILLQSVDWGAFKE